MRLIEGEIRDNVNDNREDSDNGNKKRNSNNYSSMDLSHYANIIFDMCQKYITIVINLSKLLRFHRYSHCVSDKS